MKDFWPKLYGHTVEWGFLNNALKSENVAHALLFTGSRSVGKRVCALHFAKLLFDSHNPEIDHQHLLEKQNHPDFHFIEKPSDKKEISVEQVRSLLSKLKLKSYHQGAIVAIIDDAHLLNKSASNAILKTLEEPNPNTYLILISDKPHLLLETIASRCQSISFGQLSEENCNKIIADICKATDSDTSLASKLSQSTDGTLQSLRLDSFIARSSNSIIDEKELVEHLVQNASSVESIKKQIEKVIDDFDSHSLDQLVTHLSLVDIQNVDSALFWQTLRNLIRIRLKSSQKEKLNSWAKLLEKAIQAEYNIERRNFNPQLQLCSVFLDENTI